MMTGEASDKSTCGRAIQKEIASHFTNSIILVDGSLKASIFEERAAA